MKYLLIGIADATDIPTFDKLLHTLPEVQSVEIVDTNPPKKNIHDPTGVLERNLAIPGPPLTDAEIDVLIADMEAETEFVSHEEVWAEFEKRFNPQRVA
jgi:hypothetical protein